MTPGCVLDTNVALYALHNRLEGPLPVVDVRVSIVTEIELLGYPSATEDELSAVRKFLGRIEIVPLGDAVKDEAIRLRRSLRVKLPDAVILATAVVTGSELLTNDQELIARAIVPCRSLRFR